MKERTYVDYIFAVTMIICTLFVFVIGVKIAVISKECDFLTNSHFTKQEEEIPLELEYIEEQAEIGFRENFIELDTVESWEIVDGKLTICANDGNLYVIEK